MTCVENTKIPYVELLYLPFEVKNDSIFLFKRARQAKLVKFFLNFGLSRAFLPISEVNGNKKIVTQFLEGKFEKLVLRQSMFQRARSKEGDFSIFWGAR